MGLFNWKNGQDGKTPINATNLNLAQQQLVDTIYPVGSVYISVNATDPKNLFGGTWEQIKGRFLLGTGSAVNNTDNTFGSLNNDGYNFSAGAMGGQYKNVLSTSELPEYMSGIKTTGFLGTSSGSKIAISMQYVDNINTNNNVGTDLTNSGGSQPHNNMPPYLAVYMWKRTA